MLTQKNLISRRFPFFPSLYIFLENSKLNTETKTILFSLHIFFSLLLLGYIRKNGVGSCYHHNIILCIYLSVHVSEERRERVCLPCAVTVFVCVSAFCYIVPGRKKHYSPTLHTHTHNSID